MYCAHCGSSMADELNYCKNCGARNELNWAPEDSKFRGLALCAAGVTGAVGLIGFYPIVRELLHSPMPPGTVFLIMAAYLLAVIVMFSIFIRAARRDSSAKPKTARRDVHKAQPAYLSPPNTAQLHEPHDIPASVTEHTTRTLEEVSRRER